MTKLFVICGHGAGDSGAVGGGYTEANLVRKLGAKMKEIGGSKVELLDTARDWYADGGINAALKKRIGSDPLLELHLDAASATAKGGHVIILSGTNADRYDKAIADYLSKEFPGRSQMIVKRSDLANPNRAGTHNINYRLVEVCFITNKADRDKLVNNLGSVAKGLLKAFGISAQTYTEYVATVDTYTYTKRLFNKKYRAKKVKKGEKVKVKKTWQGKKYLWGDTLDGTYIRITGKFKKVV